jgi:tRNA-2-methylthio-N6-dimethylallyladenosine synthase
MNYSDTERIESLLDEIGYKKAKTSKTADLLIFNSCSVRQKAEDKVFGFLKNIREQRKKIPNLIVALTGCMVRKSSTRNSKTKKDKLFNVSKEIDLTFKIDDLIDLPQLLMEADPKMDSRRSLSSRSKGGNDRLIRRNLSNYFEIHPIYTSKFQTFLPIMTGCNNFCAYCIVPFSRGREKSRPIKEILKEAEKMVESGVKEITLLGQNVNSYKYSFVKLLYELDKLQKKGLNRLRFTSSHPKDMSDELIKAMGKLKTLCPYVHLPVQSGDNEVLKKMNRNYTVEHYLGLIKKIRQTVPNCAISTDLIVGFPGETEEQFQNSCKLFKDVQFDMAYHARYSPRKGTLSAEKMQDDISKKEKARRWEEINDILRESSYKKNKEYIGKTEEILVEKYSKGYLRGRTRSFKEVLFKGKKDQVGKIVRVKIKTARDWALAGALV